MRAFISIFKHNSTPATLIAFFASISFYISPALATQKLEAQTISPTTTAGLQAFYQALDYDWKKLDTGIPPFILENIPKDISSAVTTKEKKRLFFMALLPMILIANQEILDERDELQKILKRNSSRQPHKRDSQRINELAKRYGLRGRPLVDHRARTILLKRIDIIPPALVLAQAANESAWGTSRFARLGNNIFGEWTYKPGTGIVPKGRPDGATYEVRKFSSIYESIRSYMNNLNRNGAYRKLQNIRAELRLSGKPITGTALAQGLSRYSQRGEEYIHEIQTMIRQNKLEQTNIASLRLPTPRSQSLTTISTTGAGLFSSRNRIIGHRIKSGQNP